MNEPKKSRLPIEQQYEAAALLFPTLFILTCEEQDGEKRRNQLRVLRRRAEAELLRRSGYSCANCRGRGQHPEFGMVCDYHPGIERTHSNNICLDHDPEV